MKKHPFPILLLLIALTPWLSGQSGETGKKNYYTGTAEDLLSLVPPPPADDSPAGMADLETILQLQRDRTPEQIARAKRIDSHSSTQMGAVAFGPSFTKENFPRTTALMQELRATRSKMIGNGKEIWKRPRPYQRSKEVVICVKKPKDLSYPSGHSATGAFRGALYSAAFPEYKPIFDAQVRETMWCRVLGGVHYPTDVMAGRDLGIRTAEAMLKNPDTQAAIKEIRDEITAYMKKHPEVEAHAKQRLAEVTAKPVSRRGKTSKDQLKIIATLVAKESHKSAVRNALTAVVDGTRKEPGNISYALHQDTVNPLKYTIIEVWKNQEAIDLHNKSAHFLAFAETIKDKVDSLSIDIIREIY
ncbi:antibiotic biosynthesis monooxygenase [Ereboglobus luteus]|nr:antibiotic biosynthesis monooxygenase [Ereboglobus luteus]